MKKFRLLIYNILILAFSLHAEDRPIVKIGVIVPLSGDMALHGTEIQRAMNLALTEHDPNSLKYQYKLHIEDNRLEGVKSVSAAQKLINVDNVDVVVTLWPPTANVVIPLTEKKQILHYTIAWDPDLAKKHDFVLSHQAMVDDIARANLKLLQTEGKNKIAFLHMEETGFNLGAKYIKELAPYYQINLVSDEAFNPNETNFNALIDKVRLKSPNAYLIWSVAPSLDILIKQILSRDKDARVTGYFDYAQDLKQIENMSFVSEMFTSDTFATAYQKKYDQTIQSKGPNAYDIMNMIISSYENFPSKKPTADQLKKYLINVKNRNGAVGKFSIDEHGNSKYSPVIRMIKNGARVLMGGG